MDYKLRTLAILCASLMILAITGTVLLINVRQDNQNESRRRQRELEAVEESRARLQEMSGMPPGAVGDDFYSYLEDESFFDRELTEYEKLLREKNGRLSLLATSVAKDLRVQILDSAGHLAKDLDLYITLDGVPYKDLDRDGTVYIGDLSPGEYEVAMQEVEGYRIPTSPLKIHVKENIDYTPISDISLLIKTEDDIDPTEEDTEDEITDEDDMDDSQLVDILPTEGSRSFGIDVSKWNGDIDWKRVRASGVDFAIIRCGYRGSKTGALIEDPKFYRNLQGAKAAGIKVGLYFFTQAVDQVEAVEEASMVLALAGDVKLDYPVFIDIESAGGKGRADKLDAIQRTDVAEAFCKTIENAGLSSGVYSSRSWLYNNLDMIRLDPYNVWLAEYRETPLYNGKYHMWQYTSKGKIDGINTDVDFNLSFL